MPGFDYGNVRLRVMKSRLLSRAELESLAGSENLQALIAGLTRSAYRQPIEAALARTTGLPVFEGALRSELFRTLGQARAFYSGEPGDLVDLVYRRYDLHNLKAVLRGVSKRILPGEIERCFLPFGDLDERTLADLVRSPDARAAIDLLASISSEFAVPLMRLRGAFPGADVPQMEQALEAWYFQETFEEAGRFRDGGRYVQEALGLEADLTNLLTVLRFAQSPVERERLHNRPGSLEPSDLFVRAGRIPAGLLEESLNQPTIEAAVKILEPTPYAQPLKTGLTSYATHSQLRGFEKVLKRFRLRWLAALIRRDPLGIGVLLGVLALKENEISNLRWIAHGVHMKLKPAEIRAELEVPA